MPRLLRIKYLLVLTTLTLLGSEAWSQTATLAGQVTSAQGQPLAGVTIATKNPNRKVVTDSKGRYSISGLEAKVIEVAAWLEAYRVQIDTVKLELGLNKHNFTLQEVDYDLATIAVEADRVRTFGIRTLGTVEGAAIYAGRKTEVVVMEDLTANLAANNARQAFARVVGLNIWESDGAGLQLGIGGRGLSPNRSANFNTRQNGYDMSADALGYPESYYTPPMEALERIEVVRGAASLQYGPQFGGMVNFVLKEGPTGKPFSLRTRQTIGSWGFFNSFNSVGGQSGNWRYYGYYQFRRGDGWRPNSAFTQHGALGRVSWQAGPRLTVGLDYSFMRYQAQQPGGLSDAAFRADPRQSIRDRNWFKVNWNLLALVLNYEITERTRLNSRFFGNFSGRDALGYLGRIDRLDPGEERDLISDQYRNVGNETRLLHRYQLGDTTSVFLVGLRYYRGQTYQRQGLAPDGSAPDFFYLNPDNLETSDYQFPSTNISFFAENAFQIGPHLTVTPGLRFEYIDTQAEGYYKQRVLDNAGNVIVDNRVDESRRQTRSLLLMGIGLSYKPFSHLETYANFSQNYRPVTFSDQRIENPSIRVDPGISDESGFNAEMGLRGNFKELFYYDVSIYYLYYRDRIGQKLLVENTPPFRDYLLRTNISDSRSMGIEWVMETDFLKLFCGMRCPYGLTLMVNVGLNDARYLQTEQIGVGERVELVPQLILRSALGFRYRNFRLSGQISYVSEQFTDAGNAEVPSPDAITGPVPAYQVADLAAGWEWRFLELEAGINNLTDNKYFTRRATGYPGPGIIPSDGRSFYLTLGIKL